MLRTAAALGGGASRVGKALGGGASRVAGALGGGASRWPARSGGGVARVAVAPDGVGAGKRAPRMAGALGGGARTPGKAGALVALGRGGRSERVRPSWAHGLVVRMPPNQMPKFVLPRIRAGLPRFVTGATPFSARKEDFWPKTLRFTLICVSIRLWRVRFPRSPLPEGCLFSKKMRKPQCFWPETRNLVVLAAEWAGLPDGDRGYRTGGATVGTIGPSGGAGATGATGATVGCSAR